MYVILFIVLFGILSIEAQETSLDRCPKNLAKDSYLKAHVEHCYQFLPYEKYWLDANNDCGKRGGHLVVINDMSTQNFLYNTLKQMKWRTKGVWIGANDREHEMHWKWVTGERIKFSYWKSGQPSCHILCYEDCGQIRLDDYGRWHDKKCSGFSFHYSYICQYDMMPTTTTSTTITTPTTTTTTTTTKSTTTPTTSQVKYTIPTASQSAEKNTTYVSILIQNLQRKVDLSYLSHKRSTSSPEIKSEVKHLLVQGDQSHQVHKMESPPGQGVDHGSLIAIILALLVGLSLGCIIGYLCVRRRRQSEKDNLPRVVFENPYYGEVQRPLTEGHECKSEEEWDVDDKLAKENSPKNDYDIPPSMCLSNPTYGAPVTLTGLEGNYDVVKSTRRVSETASEYDCPPKPLPCLPRRCFPEEGEEHVENLYESLENLKAALSEKKSCLDSAEAGEDERYVAMGTPICTDDVKA